MMAAIQLLSAHLLLLRGGRQLQQSRDSKPNNELDRFRFRTRYLADGGIIGSREFFERIYQRFTHYFQTDKEKRPKALCIPENGIPYAAQLTLWATGHY